MSGVSGRDDNVDTIKITAEKWVTEIGVDFNVYTDGSASGVLLEGGTCVVVTRGNSTSPKVMKTIRRKACYEDHLFLRGRKESPGGSGTLVTNGCATKVFTDSKSLCTALLRKSTGLDPSDSILKDPEDKSPYNGFQDIATS